MRDDDPVIAALAALDPHPGAAEPAGDEPELARMRERIMATSPQRARPHLPRRRWVTGSRLAGATTVLVVCAVAGLFLHVGRSSRRAAREPGGATTTRLVFRMEPSLAHPRITAALAREEIVRLRARLRALGGVGISARPHGASEIIVSVPRGYLVALVERYISAPAALTFTDWEANVIAPDGRTAASELRARAPAAERLSQGTDGAPGGAGDGALTLERAVALAARQPARATVPTLTRTGREWFAFGRTGVVLPGVPASRRCRATTPSCYVAGPALSRAALHAGSGERVLAVPQGTIVVEATSPRAAGAGVAYADPAARFFVMRDDAALTSGELAGAHAATSSGLPAVDIRFSRDGVAAFRRLTEAVAHRGEPLRVGTDPEFQHFAVILYGALLSVPQVDYQTYPEGVIATNRAADIAGGFSAATARRVASEARLGALPFNLRMLGGG